ncbi:type II toxin-antitoxin system HicA family toxin [Pueribacillus sp. YX66]|uniref:type II toxin-antitoxin system HicA family toxin n=1 Tax=Pueribacillus sp. YX66 TaxID=3229242 RepID=UPI00358D7462
MIKVLERIGYKVARQRGSHVRLIHDNKPPITVPLHKELGKGLTRKIIRDAGLTVDKYIKLSK